QGPPAHYSHHRTYRRSTELQYTDGRRPPGPPGPRPPRLPAVHRRPARLADRHLDAECRPGLARARADELAVAARNDRFAPVRADAALRVRRRRGQRSSPISWARTIS